MEYISIVKMSCKIDISQHCTESSNIYRNSLNYRLIYFLTHRNQVKFLYTNNGY